MQIALLYLTKPIIDDGVKQNDFAAVLGYALVMIILAAAIGLVSYGVSYASATLAAEVGKGVRRDIYTSVMSMSTPDERTRDPSDTMVRMTSDVNNIQEYSRLLLSAVLFVPAMMALLIAGVYEISKVASAVMLGSYVGVMLFMVYSGRRFRPLVEDIQSRMDTINGMIRDTASGARAIRAFGRREHEISKFDAFHEGFVVINTKFNNNTFFYPILGVAIVNFILVSVYNLGGTSVGDFEMSISELSLIVQLWGCLIGCMSVVPFLTVLSPKYAVSKARVLALFEGGTSLPDNASEDDPSAPFLVMDGVTFRSENGTVLAEDISLTIPRGGVTVIAGLSGPLKRHFVRRMLGVGSGPGSITVCGIDAYGPDAAEIRGRVCVVSDRIMMLRASIRDNILMSEDLTDDELSSICSDALLDDVLDAIPGGLDADMASCGMEFSNGQRQRIAIARGLASRARVKVFDDCFHSLDPVVEAGVIGNIVRRCSRDTTVFISDSMREASIADRVVFFDGGSIAAVGSHEELMASCPLYAEMRRMQGGSA